MNHTSLDRRLRAANPVPEATATEAPDLFSEIVASAPVSKVRHRRMRRRVVLAIVVVVATIALCSSAVLAVPAIRDLFRTVPPHVTKKEYKGAQSELSLPPGYDWPARKDLGNSVTSLGAGGGEAVTDAMWAWEDYWVKAIRSGDVAAQQRAHEELLGLLADHVVVAPAGASENWSPPNPPEGPYAVFADDGGVEMLGTAFSDAAAGRPRTLVQIVRANAPQ
jgi:hypothetical protein